MNFLHALKRRAESLPPSVGTRLSRVPFALRLGPAYARHRRRIADYEAMSAEKAEAWTVSRLRHLVAEAALNVLFYRDLYAESGVDPRAIDSLDAFRQLPIVDKAAFQKLPIDARSYRRGMTVNTGGTSGQPLVFQLEDSAFAREWAHMHHLWYARGYRKEHLKLTLRGKHFERSRALHYNAVHNELVVNADAPMADILSAALEWDGPPIRWVHGYPSLVSEFASLLANAAALDRARFRSRVYGVLLGSEFPAPAYRKPIEDQLSINVLSWYGHSEMALLAGEMRPGVYRALPTYGFAEAVRIDDSDRYRLVCTSFDNLCHPFIRYDTGDIVEPVAEGPAGLEFRIREGRIGDFIDDSRGHRHSLTAIIFGRHHAAFADLSHVQVMQRVPGAATLLVTPRDPAASPDAIRKGFDLSGLDFDWDIEVLREPVRSAAGKIKLKVDPDPS